MIAVLTAVWLLFAPAAAPTPTTAPARAPRSGTSSGPGWGAVVGGIAGGLAVGAAGSLLVLRRRTPSRPSFAPSVGAQPAPATAAFAPVPAVTTQDGADRSALLDTLIELRDVLPSQALAEKVDRSITDAGVTLIAPRPGDPFDPTAHRAIGTRPGGPTSAVTTIAELIRPGYLDKGRLLRPADVDVFQGGGVP